MHEVFTVLSPSISIGGILADPSVITSMLQPARWFSTFAFALGGRRVCVCDVTGVGGRRGSCVGGCCVGTVFIYVCTFVCVCVCERVSVSVCVENPG